MALTLTYSQADGTLTNDEGNVIANGWAGHGQGKNNPFMENVHNIGPLPRGLYRVGPWGCGDPTKPDYVKGYPKNLGPLIASLTQIEGETYGRSDFFIHGPDRDPAHYGQESRGCTVVPRPQREVVHNLAPDFIRVVA